MTSDQPQGRLSGLGLVFVYAITFCATLPFVGCGATGPVVQTRVEPELETAQAHAQTPLELRLIEGRPTGLLLSMGASAKLSTSPTATLALMRQLNNKEPITLHTLAITDELWQGLLATGGLQLVDQQLEPGSRYHYWLELNDQARAPRTSAKASITWPALVPTPSDLTIHVETRQASVELSWASQGADGAVIFRREIGGDPSAQRLTRHALVTPAQDHLYVDADVKPGGVYAYRIAMASFVDDIPCFGVPGAERFVNVPDVEPPPTQPPPAQVTPQQTSPTLPEEPPQGAP